MPISFLRYDMQGASSRHKAKLVPARDQDSPPVDAIPQLN